MVAMAGLGSGGWNDRVRRPRSIMDGGGDRTTLTGREDSINATLAIRSFVFIIIIIESIVSKRFCRRRLEVKCESGTIEVAASTNSWRWVPVRRLTACRGAHTHVLCTQERRVVGVYVGCLDLDQTLSVFARWTQAFAKELRNNLNDLSVQTGESLQLLGLVQKNSKRFNEGSRR